MSDKNIGKLLRDFGITKPEDYYNKNFSPRKKQAFYKRLFKMMRDQIKATLSNFLTASGVKFYFAINDNKDQCRKIPSAVFLRKCSFFSRITLITFSFKLDEHSFINQSPRVLGSHRGTKNNNEFDDLLKLICECRELLENDYIKIIPLFNSKKIDSVLHSIQQEIQANSLISANFKSQRLIDEFEEKDLVRLPYDREDSKLLQPHFSHISPRKIVKLREREKDIYLKFEDDLKEKLFKSDSNFCFRNLAHFLTDDTKITPENNLLEELKYVHKGVIELKRDCSILLSKNCKDLETTVILGGMASLIGILAPQFLVTEPVIQAFSNLISVGGAGVNVLKCIRDVLDRAKETEEWKKRGEVYLAWRICDPNAWLII